MPSAATKDEKARRGKSFERLLRDALAAEDLSPHISFRPKGEEIDGSFVMDGKLYLIEAKWRSARIPASSVYEFQGKLNGKLLGTIGVFISASGFSKNAPAAVTVGKPLNVILWGREDLDAWFAGAATFRQILERKLRDAAEKGEIYAVFRPPTPSLTVRRGRLGIREAMRELRSERAAEFVSRAASVSPTKASYDELEDAVARLSVTAINALAEESSYEEARAFQSEIDKVGGLAVHLLKQTEDADGSNDWIANQLARAARHFEHTVPPWDLWLLTLSFYADRAASRHDFDSLEALCGLLIEASIAVDDWEWPRG